MANTFELIQSYTVGAGGASSIDFTSIPSTYTDLCLKLSLRSNAGGAVADCQITFNGSSANFTNRYIYGNGASALSGSNAYGNGFIAGYNGAGSTSSTFSNKEVYIPNYAGSSYKSFSIDSAQETNASTAYLHLMADLWSNTAAITSISVAPESSDTFVQYSTAYLYGVKNA